MKKVALAKVKDDLSRYLRLAEGQELDATVVDLKLHFINFNIILDHAFGQVLITIIQCLDRTHDQILHQFTHL